MWQQCRKCTQIDHQCDQRTTYRLDLSELVDYNHHSWPYARRPYPDCSVNVSDCQKSLCECDAYFTYHVMSLLQVRVGYNYDYVGNKGAVDEFLNPEFITNFDGTGFDHANKCPRRPVQPPDYFVGWSDEVPPGSSEGSPLTDCCGVYPHRYPYNPQRQTCCGDKESPRPFLVTIGAC